MKPLNLCCAKSSTNPIRKLQRLDPRKLPKVVANQRYPKGQSMRGDLRIQRTNRCSRKLKLLPYRPINLCRSHIEISNLQWLQKMLQGQTISCRATFFDTEKQLGHGNT